MNDFQNQQKRQEPAFVALVASLCCLSCRYTQDIRLTSELRSQLLAFGAKATTSLSERQVNITLVQALFNMSVVQEGTDRPAALWTYLTLAIS